MGPRKQLLLGMVVGVVLGLSFLVAYAQIKNNKTAGSSITVTGCLGKGDSPNEFYLTSEDGKKYELRSNTVALADHVGHKVKTTGTAVKTAQDDDDDDKKDEARESEAPNLQVTDIQMISDRCQ